LFKIVPNLVRHGPDAEFDSGRFRLQHGVQSFVRLVVVLDPLPVGETVFALYRLAMFGSQLAEILIRQAAWEADITTFEWVTFPDIAVERHLEHRRGEIVKPF
jgi:hypothetical protein